MNDKKYTKLVVDKLDQFYSEIKEILPRRKINFTIDEYYAYFSKKNKSLATLTSSHHNYETDIIYKYKDKIVSAHIPPDKSKGFMTVLLQISNELHVLITVYSIPVDADPDNPIKDEKVPKLWCTMTITSFEGIVPAIEFVEENKDLISLDFYREDKEKRIGLAGF